MEEWPWQAQVAIAGLVLPYLVMICRWIFRQLRGADDTAARMHERGWERASELEEEIRLLRIALHRANTRSSVRLTISEILVVAMPLPLVARIEAVKQARLIAEQSLSRGEPS